ncbi:MAG: TIGR03936 family radical SAM-associated protein [Hungatella sp.]
MKIRIKFSKLGAMKFVGHLDLLRYFQKAMRRAEVDICYSEGFSPHQVMSFAAPLGVGLTGTGEYMDIEVHSTKDSKTMIRQLNAVMVDGIQILSYRKLEDDSKNAMSLVMAADYTISFYEPKKPQDSDEFFREMKRFYDQEQILIEKKTKKSEKEVNIKPLILDLHREHDSLFLKLATGSVENLKPELVLEAFYQFQHLEYPKCAFQIQREEVYGDVMSLEEMGEDIE